MQDFSKMTSEQMYAHDDDVFNKWLQLKDSKVKVAILNEGKGDCVCFRKWLDDEGIKDIKIYGCYADLFEGYDFNPIGEATQMGYDLSKYSVYKWMNEKNWTGNLYDAYKTVYKNIRNI